MFQDVELVVASYEGELSNNLAKRLTRPKPPREDITVGFPEFWPVAQDSFRPFLSEIPRLQQLARDLLSTSNTGPVTGLKRVVFRAHAAAAANSFGAVFLLCMNGYPHDAMRVVRSMFEICV